MNHVDVGYLRQQSAFLPADCPIYIRIGDAYVRIVAVWPDTQQAARGHGLYLLLDEDELAEKQRGGK